MTDWNSGGAPIIFALHEAGNRSQAHEVLKIEIATFLANDLEVMAITTFCYELAFRSRSMNNDNLKFFEKEGDSYSQEEHQKKKAAADIRKPSKREEIEQDYLHPYVEIAYPITLKTSTSSYSVS